MCGSVWECVERVECVGVCVCVWCCLIGVGGTCLWADNLQIHKPKVVKVENSTFVCCSCQAKAILCVVSFHHRQTNQTLESLSLPSPASPSPFLSLRSPFLSLPFSSPFLSSQLHPEASCQSCHCCQIMRKTLDRSLRPSTSAQTPFLTCQKVCVYRLLLVLLVSAALFKRLHCSTFCAAPSLSR